jgi:class 3 adenylate cyclase/tetratricopeptide (TPR) repeat protein
VTLCANCGHENREGAKFCEECAAPLAVPPSAREQRKTVTVLFCDVTGSTSLGESTDPEALRALLARYFERMKQILESHGGSVEKFIGDAVMAVFGVPQVHEDDALRAVRAAVEMRDAVPELGLQARIGVNTGEVVTGTQERLATGDAVNVAARLEQAASPGEILIGSETLRLVRDAVEAEPVEPLELKGKAEPVPSHRLLGVQDPEERPHATSLVGRAHELETLVLAWQRALGEERCELVTVVGEPGVGKSRLAAEFLAATGARLVRGRCLSYGDGITYWPVVEVLKQLDAVPTDSAAAAPLRSLLGESEQGTSAEEIGWGFRKLLEEQAREQPLVCVFEDIQWGEDTFLNLIEHVALLAGGASLLLLCLARPELLDRRPQWPVGLRLEPLDDSDVQALIADELSAELRDRIAASAGGNPLFVTEMVAMAREAGGDVAVPPNLKALLAARLDQLETAERGVLECGAVEGEIFHRGSVQALAEDAQVTPRLASLVRKELLRPDKPQLAGDDAFRFCHLLIRDAAYEALPKATRADLHERFADWFALHGRELVELDELVGYHLEQAAAYRAELGSPNPGLAERAAERLASAGKRALWRGDGAAVGLIERALALTRPYRADAHLEVELAEAHWFCFADVRQAAAVADQAVERARAAADERGEALARVVAAHARMEFDPAVDADTIEVLAREALPLLEGAGDHAGLVHVWLALGPGVGLFRARFEDWVYATERALHHAKLAGEKPTDLMSLGSALRLGPRPADEALRTLDDAAPEAPHPGILLSRAHLLAMLARFDEAWPLALEASSQLRELTGHDRHSWTVGEVAALKGDHSASERHFRDAFASFEADGARPVLSTLGPLLGRTLCELDRHKEAEPLVQLGRQFGDAQDITTQVLWRRAEAVLCSHRGDHARAERLAREAVDWSNHTDALNWQGDALADLGLVLAAAGRSEEAVEGLKQALDRYERKKNLARVAQVKPRLEELRANV